MGPEDPIQLVGPATLLQVESFLESVDDYLVSGLGLTVALRVSRRGHVEPNSPSVAELFEVVGYELGSVVCDYLVREPVPADDVFPDELMHLLVGNAGVGFCFHPFGEVISQD